MFWPLWLVLFIMAEGVTIGTGFAYYVLYCESKFLDKFF